MSLIADYVFTIYHEGHIEDNKYVETSNSDLTIDEFKYLKTCYPANLSIFKSENGYVIILKDVDITTNPIIFNICRKSKRKINNNFCDLCKYELQKCTRGTLKETEDGSVIIARQIENIENSSNTNLDKIAIRNLSYFEKTLLSEKFVVNEKLELIDLNDTSNENDERDHLYYAFFDRIYSNNICTLSYLIHAYENNILNLDKRNLLGKIKYLISISEPFELQKLHGINGYENPCVSGYDPKTKQINEIVRCMLSPYSNVGKPFDLYPKKTIVYETKIKNGQFANMYECYIDTGYRATKNLFYIAIMNEDYRFILDCINFYVNSMDMLCLAKLCGNKYIHDLIYSGSNEEFIKENKYYDFYKSLKFYTKPTVSKKY
jgi:hypothetical protein